MVDEQLLKEFKESLKIYHTAEDSDLTRILGSSIEAVDNLVGGSPIIANQPSAKKTLVFNRGRYDYHGDLDLFNLHFQHEIFDLSFQNRTDDEDETGEV